MNDRLLVLRLGLFGLLARYIANGSAAFSAELGSFRERRSTVEAEGQLRIYRRVSRYLTVFPTYEASGLPFVYRDAAPILRHR